MFLIDDPRVKSQESCIFSKKSLNVVLCSFCTCRFSGSCSSWFCCCVLLFSAWLYSLCFVVLRHMRSRSKRRRAPRSSSRNLGKEKRWKSLKSRRTASCPNPSTHSCWVIICLFLELLHLQKEPMATCLLWYLITGILSLMASWRIVTRARNTKKTEKC